MYWLCNNKLSFCTVWNLPAAQHVGANTATKATAQIIFTDTMLSGFCCNTRTSYTVSGKFQNNIILFTLYPTSLTLNSPLITQYLIIFIGVCWHGNITSLPIRQGNTQKMVHFAVVGHGLLVHYITHTYVGTHWPVVNATVSSVKYN